MSEQGQPGQPWYGQSRYGQPLYGDPQYPTTDAPPYASVAGAPHPPVAGAQYPPAAGAQYPPAGSPYPPAPAGYPPPPGAARSNTRRWLAAGAALLAVLGVSLYLALSGGSSKPKRPTANPPVAAPSIVIPSIAVPSIAGPPVTIPSFPGGVPSGLGNPCGFAPSAFGAATTYVGLAEIGEIGFAQSCVYKKAVPRSVTASISASGTALYSPTGVVTGTTVEFRSIDGTATLEVTASEKPDGKYWITKVEKR